MLRDRPLLEDDSVLVPQSVQGCMSSVAASSGQLLTPLLCRSGRAASRAGTSPWEHVAWATMQTPWPQLSCPMPQLQLHQQLQTTNRGQLSMLPLVLTHHSCSSSKCPPAWSDLTQTACVEVGTGGQARHLLPQAHQAVALPSMQPCPPPARSLSSMLSPGAAEQALLWAGQQDSKRCHPARKLLQQGMQLQQRPRPQQMHVTQSWSRHKQGRPQGRTGPVQAS